MIRRIAIINKPFPLVLKDTNIRYYALITLFVLLNVGMPWAFHQFQLAGATYLPMHLFVLIAGLAFGWQGGLIVGLLTPLTSYAVSGMPVLRILPQLVIELSAYGLLAGILRQKLGLRVIWSLLGAMIGGRLALLLAILVIYLLSGAIYSPLGLETNPFLSVWSAIKQGWPGILIQLVFITVIFWTVGIFNLKGRVE
ncbi:ECF transporter S component [Chloroflexota bacterium]